MTTRRQFAGGILAAGALANFALVAAPGDNGNGIPATDTARPTSATARARRPTRPTPAAPARAWART